MAIVSVVDADRIWFKSHHGADITETTREVGLCASAILQYDPWIVSDAIVDPRALANPLVADGFGLRFYAGMPLTTSDGHNLGTICVIDREPREVTLAEREILRNLAAIVMDHLELRKGSFEALKVETLRRERAELETHMQTLRSESAELQTGVQTRRRERAELETGVETLRRERAELEAGAQTLRREGAELETDRVRILAQTLQRSLLPPHLPTIAGLELASAYLPSSVDQVGGDFYDVFPVSARSWGIVIGDVCGKGPEAAAMTALARYTLRAAACDAASPEDVLSKVNQSLAMREAASDGRYSALVYARLRVTDAGTKIQIASGGHSMPLLLRASGRVGAVGGAGSLVGVLPEARFSSEGMTLKSGDTLLFYTDGVTELRWNGEFFGEERLADIFASCAGSSATEIVECVVAAVREFGTELRDDIALLVLRVT